MWTRLWNRCRFLFRRRQFDLELREEMDFHREMLAAGTVTFAVVDALALRQLPYYDPARLTAVARVSGRDTGYASLAPQDYFALARGVSAFDGVAAAGHWSLPGETADSPPVIGAR